MRKTLALAAAAASLAVPGTAAAQDDDSFLLWEQSSKPNTSTGFNMAINLGEADQQKQLTGMVIKFPPGSRIDADGAPLCTASREERIDRGHEAVCPAESRLGSGEASAIFQSGPITADLSFWNVRSPDRDVLNVEQVVNGNKAGYFTGTLGSQSITFVFSSKLISFNGSIRQSTRTVGGEKVAYLRTPPTCSSRKRRWKVRAKLLFEDKTTKTLYAYPACGVK